MTHSPLAGPIVALVSWTLVVQAWMFATRFRELGALGISLKGRRGSSTRNALENVFPDAVNWKAHNYANLMEQPTIFYAIVLALVVLDLRAPVDTWLAWTYVASRIAHSLIQATVNIVTYRLAAFVAGSLCVTLLAGHALSAIFIS